MKHKTGPLTLTEEQIARLPKGALHWLLTGERGISSETVFSYLTGIDVMDGWDYSHPRDPADLRRVRLLFLQVPTLFYSFYHMRRVSLQWLNLIANWDELCIIMDNECPLWQKMPCNHASKTYAFLQKIYAPTYAYRNYLKE